MTEQLYAGLKKIAKRVECSPTILRQWIKQEGFPACKIGKSGPWRATESNIAEWMRDKTKALPAKEEG